MKLPSAEEYLQIVDKKNPGTLATLFNHKFILDEEGETYLAKRSRNHIVFKTEHLSRFYAVRFFLHDDDELFRRYHQVEAYLKPNFSWKVPFRFMDEEYYPVILMDWIDALSFTQYLDLIINETSLISKLQQQLISLSRELESNGIGHGNLNMKHIRFVKQADGYVLKLIDYDSMFIPSFREKDSVSVGTSGFQHPMRLASDFSETIDRFSIWVFVTSLEAFKINSSLWVNAKENGFNKEEQILFTYRDLAFSQQSATFQKLRRYNNKSLEFYCDNLIAFCNSTSLDEVEAPRLHEEKHISFAKTYQQQANETAETINTVVSKPPVTASENIILQKTIAPIEKTIIPIEKSIIPGKEIRNNKIFEPEQRILKEEEHEVVIPLKQKKKKRIFAFVIIAVLLLSAVAFIVWNNQSKKKNTEVAAVAKPIQEMQQSIQKQEETLFTSTNITQFLFQLYQSYNKRNLSSILSNYADSVNQYYDAGSMPKNKLGDVIKNLFIRPVYYECHPDLTTLKFNVLGDSCKLSISINETIKADRRSKTETYSSKIEYIVDTSFKIISEKNIE